MVRPLSGKTKTLFFGPFGHSDGDKLRLPTLWGEQGAAPHQRKAGKIRGDIQSAFDLVGWVLAHGAVQLNELLRFKVVQDFINEVPILWRRILHDDVRELGNPVSYPGDDGEVPELRNSAPLLERPGSQLLISGVDDDLTRLKFLPQDFHNIAILLRIA